MQRPLVEISEKQRISELLLLFVALPLAYAVSPIQYAAMGLLAAGTLAALVILLRDPTFDRRQLLRSEGLKREWKSILLLFLANAAVLLALIYFLAPTHLFDLIKRHPMMLVGVVIFYPVFSAYPQEIIFRTFFFHRYKVLFNTPRAMIAANALIFGWIHVIFRNPVAIILCIAGGLIFAWRFHRTRSLLATTIEHSLYGILLFVLGLGIYFVDGNFKTLDPVSTQAALLPASD